MRNEAARARKELSAASAQARQFRDKDFDSAMREHDEAFNELDEDLKELDDALKELDEDRKENEKAFKAHQKASACPRGAHREADILSRFGRGLPPVSPHHTPRYRQESQNFLNLFDNMFAGSPVFTGRGMRAASQSKPGQRAVSEPRKQQTASKPAQAESSSRPRWNKSMRCTSEDEALLSESNDEELTTTTSGSDSTTSSECARDL